MRYIERPCQWLILYMEISPCNINISDNIILFGIIDTDQEYTTVLLLLGSEVNDQKRSEANYTTRGVGQVRNTGIAVNDYQKPQKLCQTPLLGRWKSGR